MPRIEPLESRRLLAVTSSLSGYAYLDPQDSGVKAADEAGFAGLTVQLQSVDSQGNLSNVSGVGPEQTLSDGSYSFTGLAAGTYQIQISPSSKLAVGILSPGSAGGTAGNDEIQVTLAAGQDATDYNFAILGAQTDEISLRMFMASTGSLTQFLTTLHTPPSVDPGAGSTFSTTYSSEGTGVAITSSSATITAPDSPTLTSMTVTIQNLQDGSSEQLSADTTGTTLTSNYADGVLTVSGVADVATYETVLQSVKYSDNSSSASLGTRTLSIVVNDGTDVSPAAIVTVNVVQGTGPAGYTIAADQSEIGSSAAASTGFTFSDAGVGDTYNYTVSSSGGGTAVSGSGTVTAATQDVTGINVSTLPDGTLTYSVTLTDSSGQTGAAATATATLQTVAPTGYTITANQSEIGSSAAASTGFTFAGAEVGDTYNYSISSGGGGTAVTGSGSVTSATESVTGINVSSLSDGTLTFSVTLTDAAGNVGTAATATATLDTVAPTGYSITANQSLLNATTAASAGFTFAGAEVGDTYNYSISSSGGGTAVTGSGSVTSATENVTGINVSSLPSGTLTYSVTLTDAAGNTGAAATATATLDETLPTGYTITADKAAVNATTGADTGFTFAGATAGSTYNYTVASSGGGTAISGSGSVTSATQDITGINVTTLPDGTLTYSVTLTDAAGNTGAAATATSILDTVAPSGYTIAANQAVVNVAASTNTGFTFSGAELNATYNYTVTSSGGTGSVSGSGTVTSATEQVTGVNVSTLPDGTLTFSVTLTDEAGNVGNPATATATLDTAVPSGYTIAAVPASLNATTDIAAGFQFTAAVVGTTYNYTVTSSGGAGSVSGSGSVTSATQDITGINVSGLPDGTLTYSVRLTNAVGNPGVAATATATLDKTVPSGYTIAAVPAALNAAAAVDAGFKFSGAETGTTYNFSISSNGGGSPITGSGSVTSATQSVSGINISALSDGTLTYSVTLTDAAGNVGATATASGILDRVAPSGYTIAADQTVVNIAASTNTGFTFSGAEVNTTYNYTVTSSGGAGSVSGSGTVTSATEQITGVNVSALADGTLTFSVTLTDEAGNVGNPATATATLDTAVPSGYTITADRAVINASQAVSTGFTFAGAATGTTYNFTATSSGGAGSVSGSGSVTSATQDITGINVSGLPDGVLTYSVTLTNAVGNTGVAATATATLDLTAPSGYTIAAVPSVLNATTDTAAGFQFTGAELNTTYNYSITSSGGGSPVTGSGTVTSATQQVTGVNVSSLSDGTLTYSVTLTDSAGNVGAAATATATLDTVAPSGYTIAANQATVNLAASTDTGFTFSGAELNTTYNYLVTSSGGGTAVSGSGSVTSATQQVTGVNVSSLGSGTLTFSVTLTDEAGNVGNPATAAATLDLAAPSGYSVAADQAILGPIDDAAAGFTISGGVAGETYSYTISSSGGSGTVTGSGSVTSATQDVTGINVSSLPDGSLTYSVILTNVVGNPGAAATATATLATTAPSGYTIEAVPAALNATTATAAGFDFTGAETGTTYNYTISSSGGTGSVTGSGSVTSATQQVTGINVSSLSDGTLTFSVTLTDALGNVGAAATASGVLDSRCAQRLHDQRERGGVQRLRLDRRRLHLCRGRDGHDLQLYDHQQWRNRLGNRQRQRDLGHAADHRRGRLLACGRDFDLQRHLDRRSRQ